MNIFVSVDGKWSVDLKMTIEKELLVKDKNGKNILCENGEKKKEKVKIEDQFFRSTENLESGAKKNQEEYEILNERVGYSDLMKQIQQNIPNYKYKGIEDNTVLGVLSRMIGEVRRLKDVLMDDEHPVTKIKDRITFNFHRDSFQNEIVRLASFRKNATRPHGLVSNCFHDSYRLEDWKGRQIPLLTENEFSRCLFSLFDLENEEELFDFIKSLNSVQQGEDLLVFSKRTNQEIGLNKLDEEMTKWKFITKKFAEKTKAKEFSKEYIEFCNYVGVNPEKFKNGNMMGLAFIHLISFVGQHHPEWKGYVLAMNDGKDPKVIISGFNSENYSFTFKDFTLKYFGLNSYVYGGIYMIELKPGMLDGGRGMKSSAQLGITRESGILEIHLDLSPDEEVEWKRLINESGVNVFQVGKKGLGYVKEIESFGHF